MINNFEKIQNIISSERDFFYFVQIIKRKKENKDLEKSQKLIETFYIRNSTHLYEMKDKMITIAKENNARIYINLNRRSGKIIHMKFIQELINRSVQEVYVNNVQKIYNSVCGRTNCASKDNKRWIVDIDSKDLEYVNFVADKIKNITKNTESIKDIIETINGYHLITIPFNTKESFPFFNCDIHKDGFTLLYYGG